MRIVLIMIRINTKKYGFLIAFHL